MQDGASGAMASVSGAAKRLLSRKGSSGKVKGSDSIASSVQRRGSGTPNASPSREQDSLPRSVTNDDSFASSIVANTASVAEDSPRPENTEGLSRKESQASAQDPFLPLEAEADVDDIFNSEPEFVKSLGSHFSTVKEIRQNGVQFVPATELPIGTTLTSCWQRLFCDASRFLTRWHVGHGEREESGEPLKEIPPWKGGELPGPMWRDFECHTGVQAPWGQIVTKFVERQRLIAVVNPDGARYLLFQVSAQTPDVMYGNTFRCDALVRLQEAQARKRVTLDIIGRVHMLKSTIMRSKIVSTGTTGLRESYTELARLAQAELGGGTSGAAATSPAAANTPNEAPVPPSPSRPTPPVSPKPTPQPGILSMVVVGVAFVLAIILCVRASAAAGSLGLVADAVAAAAEATRAGNSTDEIARKLGPTQARVRQIVSSTAGLALWSCCASAVASASIVLAQVRNIHT